MAQRGHDIYVTLEEESLQSRDCYTQTLAPVQPGSTLKYLISYRNISTKVQKRVAIGVNLAPGLLLISDSTMVANASYPHGISVGTNHIASGGIVIGNYGANANAYISFKVGVPANFGSCDAFVGA